MTLPPRTSLRPALLFLVTAGAVLVLASCSDSTGPSDEGGLDFVEPDVSPITYSVSQAMTENKASHAEEGDDAWDPLSAVPITLHGTSATVVGEGVTVQDDSVTITTPGTYVLSGTLADGHVVVDTEEDGIVRLVLDGVDLSNTTGSPLAVLSADKTVIVLTENSVNHISDGVEYVFPDPEEDEPNAALYSKDDLTITGPGSLVVDGHYNDGIGVKDGLVLAGGTLTVNAEDDGIRGKDYIVVTGGTYHLTTSGDGFKSDNDDDADSGYILIQDGSFTVAAQNDGFQAETDLLISGGTFDITTAGGSLYPVSDDDDSAKGLKAGVLLVVETGTLDVDAADDAVHSNAHMGINQGSFTLASGDDAIHADSTLGVNGGDIVITRSYEGLESMEMVIAGGTIRAVSSDDALNGAGDDTGFGGSNFIHILDGDIAVTADGDGIDVNGSIVMTGGRLVIHGPTRQDNSAIDYDRSFQITGGELVAAGSARMAQAPDETSGQYILGLQANSTPSGGTLIHIESASGDDVLTFAPTRAFSSVVFSSPSLTGGTTYRVYLGGSHSGTATDGLYASGSYTGGSQVAEFTVSSVITRVAF